MSASLPAPCSIGGSSRIRYRGLEGMPVAKPRRLEKPFAGESRGRWIMTQEQATNEPGTAAAKRGPRILLVDDDAEIIEAMRYALQSRGYDVVIARDGNQGLVMAEREDPDLVILDMMMPKRSGFLVLERLRRTRKVPTKIIMVTANEGNRHKAYAEMLGVDDYIRKPFAMDRLLASVERLLPLSS